MGVVEGKDAKAANKNLIPTWREEGGNGGDPPLFA